MPPRTAGGSRRTSRSVSANASVSAEPASSSGGSKGAALAAGDAVETRDTLDTPAAEERPPAAASQHFLEFQPPTGSPLEESERPADAQARLSCPLSNIFFGRFPDPHFCDGATSLKWIEPHPQHSGPPQSWPQSCGCSPGRTC